MGFLLLSEQKNVVQAHICKKPYTAKFWFEKKVMLKKIPLPPKKCLSPSLRYISWGRTQRSVNNGFHLMTSFVERKVQASDFDWVRTARPQNNVQCPWPVSKGFCVKGYTSHAITIYYTSIKYKDLLSFFKNIKELDKYKRYHYSTTSQCRWISFRAVTQWLCTTATL